MSYVTGVANSPAELRTALLNAAQADGWVLTGDVLSRNGVYFRVQLSGNNVTLQGCESDAFVNPAPNAVKVGEVYFSLVPPYPATHYIAYPATYHYFGFAQEVYFVVNYSSSFYQWLAFGKSTVPGISGQGGWFGGSASALSNCQYNGPCNIDADGQATTWGYHAESGPMALAWGAYYYYNGQRNFWVNHGLDGYGWKFGATVEVDPVTAALALVPLVAIQPSAWNSDAVLLPIRSYLVRPSFKTSLLMDLEHARILRIDNLDPEQVLTMGADKWKVFPWYAKNSAARDGGSGNHSGTFGWAIRYEGP